MARQDVAVNPVTIVIKECITLSTAMRKYTRYTSQLGVAALLGGGSDIFSNQDDSLADAFSNLASKTNDPLLSGFIQLRLMLNNLKTLDEVDALTVLQPFLLVISTASTSGYITSLALDSIHKIFRYNILNEHSKNYVAAFRQTVHSLTHCRFEGSEQTSDDSVLLKVLSLIETIVVSSCGDVLSDSLMSDVIQTVMSLACNKRRTEVLRKAAEMSMMSITVKLLAKLRAIEPTNTEKYINDESFATALLKEDIIGTMPRATTDVSVENGTLVATEAKKHEDAPVDDTTLEENYGLPVVKDYLGILISLIVIENSHKQNNSTKVFGLHLLNMTVELAGDLFPKHPRLFSLVSDPIFKNILYLIQNTDKLSLLQAALQLFTTLTIILGDCLQSQIELTLKTIFSILLDEKKGNDNKIRPSAVKELLVEQISILWTRSPSFFTSIFINYDCDLERSDLAINFLKKLTKLALPESALITADSVPPICLEGFISLIDDMHANVQRSGEKFDSDLQVDILVQRERKNEFIRCVEEFNKKPKVGIPLLIEKNFIKSEDESDIASFLFENNTRLNKKTVGEYLASPDKVSLLRKFIDLFDFENLRVDEALRILLTKFRLPGESQQIERIVEAFSAKYVSSQHYDESKAGKDIEGDYSTVQPDSDSVFILSYSIILLNTDLHNPQVKKHMTLDDYTYNLKGCNNQKDFPMWYMERTYYSIRDKEIVMPEEHHGSDGWFDDVWNNLISSNTVLTELNTPRHNSIEDMDPAYTLHFDRAIFQNVGSQIVSTLFKIFAVASDDNISTRMLSTIDKCSQLASFFGFTKLYNGILTETIKFTTLTGETKNARKLYDFNDVPVVLIHLEDTMEVITVSSQSVRLGQDFKGQLATVVLSRILGNTGKNTISKEIWVQLLNILLVLYEGLVIPPDLCPQVQRELALGPLPKPSAEYNINKTKFTKGLLSTFASYLKGDEEPTEEEIAWSVKGMETIENSQLISSILGASQETEAELISHILGAVKLEKNGDNSRFFEQEILFLCELAISMLVRCQNKSTGRQILTQLKIFAEINGISKAFRQRLLSYNIFVIKQLETPEAIISLIDKEMLFNNEIYDSEFFESDPGMSVLNSLLSLSQQDAFTSELLANEGFWKLLRRYAPLKKCTLAVYNFLDNFIITNQGLITDENFMWMLGLLDEISSTGAVGGRWEEEFDRLVKSGRAVEKENPYQEIVDLSLKSINLTSQLIKVRTNLTKTEIVALIQALAHQCLNPSYQLRLYALSSLEDAMTKGILVSNDTITVSELFEHGLFPLIDNSKNINALPLLDIMSTLSRIYLYYLECGKTTNDTYMKVQNMFNKYVENPTMEQKLQELITAKKEIEKNINGPSRPHTVADNKETSMEEAPGPVEEK
ncbi:FAEL061Wp [Eremothecium gossypii FDAG1]|nr:FAEL061Wp [Eremothecium gossypii FDAG1]